MIPLPATNKCTALKQQPALTLAPRGSSRASVYVTCLAGVGRHRSDERDGPAPGMNVPAQRQRSGLGDGATGMNSKGVIS